MTSTESLSARIARLEDQAAKLPELHGLRERVVQEIARQQAALADVDAEIVAGDHARRILEDLTGHADRVLASGALVNSETNSDSIRQDPQPEPHSEPLPPAPVILQPPTRTAEPPEFPASESTSDLDSNSTSIPAAPVSTPVDSDPTEEFPTPPTQMDRIRAHIATLPAGTAFTKVDVATALEIAEKSTGTYLALLVKNGELDRIPEPGNPRALARYVRAGEITSPAPDVDHRQVILQHFQQEENQVVEFNHAAIQDQLRDALDGLTLADITAHLDALTMDGLLESVDDDGERWYSLILRPGQEQVA